MRAAVVQTVIVAALLVAQNVPQPQVNSGVADQVGGTYAVPLAVFLATAISIAVAYCLALAGALRVRAAAGLPIVAATTIALAAVPVAKLRVGGADIGPHATEVWLRWAQLAVLATLWLWVLGRAAARRRSPHPRAVAGVLTVIAAYYLLEAGVWASYARAGQAAAGTGFLLDDLSFQAVLLPVFLTLVILLGSTDLLEWGEITARWAVARVRKARPRLLLTLTPLAALAVVANVVRLAPGAVGLELVVGGILAGTVSLLAGPAPGPARRYSRWSDDIRSRAVFLGAVAIFVYTTIFSSAITYAGSALGLQPALTSRLYWLVSVPVLLALLVAGLFFLLRGRAAQPGRRTMVLFLAMAGMLILIAGLPGFLGASHLPGVLPRHFSLLSSIQLAAALGALIWIGRLLPRKNRGPAAVPVANVLVLLVSLQLVTLIIDLLNGIAALSALSTFVLAGLFLVVGFWGLVTSGDQLNAAQPAGAPYPRAGRVMLLVSYTLAANATLLYLGTLRVPVTGGGPAAILTTDFITPAGLGVLGSSLVALAFILRRRRHVPPARSRRVPADPAPGPRRARSHPVRRGLRSARMLATALLLVIVSGCAATHLGQANAKLLDQPYQTLVPGPGCDARGASWSVPPGDPVSTRCLKAGLQVVAAPQGSGDVQFLPPSGSFSRNYRVSVRVDLSHLADGCASIYTRSSAAGHYSSSICGSEAAGARQYGWNIQRVESSPGQWLLGTGALAVSAVYTLTVTAENSDQQISVNNATASAADPALSATKFISLGISNSGTQAASVVFSDFRFTPLSAGARPGAATTALPVTTRDRVVVWYTDVGKAELALLTARVDSVGLAGSLAAQGQACSKLAAAVTTARADPQIPDAAARTWLAQALAQYARSAADCRAGASSHDSALIDQAAAATRAATGDIQQFDADIKRD